jgi:HlyD family secretion protein
MRGGWIWTYLRARLASQSSAPHPSALVRRLDLPVTILAAGRVDSAERTIIECRLEATEGMSWGSSTVLSLLPEGPSVRKGDVLCTLDSSRYEEALRLQEIIAGQAEADFTAAELDLEVARLAVSEYRDGLKEEALKSLMGQIALVRADRERAHDRVRWARSMLAKGYLSRAQVATEDSNLSCIEHRLETSERALQAFKVWNAPKTLKILEAGVLMAESLYRYQTSRLTAARDRLRFCRGQVDACTIRAPHDGFLIYYVYPHAPAYRLQEGSLVMRTQKLFYLPDLRRMEVNVLFHETIVRDLRPGMRALVELDALPGRGIAGRLESIATFPMIRWWSDERFFNATVALDDIPADLMPGMTAAVRVLFTKGHVLAIPGSAVGVDRGRSFCQVLRDGAVQRREVKLGVTTPDLVEVEAGLSEAEEVVLEPGRVQAEAAQRRR